MNRPSAITSSKVLVLIIELNNLFIPITDALENWKRKDFVPVYPKFHDLEVKQRWQVSKELILMNLNAVMEQINEMNRPDIRSLVLVVTRVEIVRDVIKAEMRKFAVEEKMTAEELYSMLSGNPLTDLLGFLKENPKNEQHVLNDPDQKSGEQPSLSLNGPRTSLDLTLTSSSNATIPHHDVEVEDSQDKSNDSSAGPQQTSAGNITKPRHVVEDAEQISKTKRRINKPSAGQTTTENVSSVSRLSTVEPTQTLLRSTKTSSTEIEGNKVKPLDKEIQIHRDTNDQSKFFPTASASPKNVLVDDNRKGGSEHDASSQNEAIEGISLVKSTVMPDATLNRDNMKTEEPFMFTRNLEATPATKPLTTAKTPQPEVTPEIFKNIAGFARGKAGANVSDSKDTGNVKTLEIKSTPSTKDLSIESEKSVTSESEEKTSKNDVSNNFGSLNSIDLIESGRNAETTKTTKVKEDDNGIKQGIVFYYSSTSFILLYAICFVKDFMVIFTYDSARKR